MTKSLIIIFVVMLILLLVLIVFGGILVNQYKVAPSLVGTPLKRGSEEAVLIKKPAPPLTSEPIYFHSSKKKKPKPIKEIEILPAGHKPGVFVN